LSPKWILDLYGTEPIIKGLYQISYGDLRHGTKEEEGEEE
jgi:hypothetical protein